MVLNELSSARINFDAVGGDTVGKCYSEIWFWAIGFHVHSSDTTVEGWHTDHTTVLTGKHDGVEMAQLSKLQEREAIEKHTHFSHVFISKIEMKSEIWPNCRIFLQCFVCLKFCDTRAAESNLRLINPSLTLTHTHAHMQVPCRNMGDVFQIVKHLRRAL